MVRSLGRTALAVVVLVGMGAGVAHAQENRLADAPMHLGPLYVTPTLKLVQFGIDNNVFNESGGPASDYTFRGGLRVAVELPLSRLRVTASSTIDYLYFHRFTNLRGFNLDLDTHTELRLRRVTFFFEDSFRNTTDRPNLEIDARARHMQNNTEAGLNVQLFPKLAIEIAARMSYIEFAQDDLVATALANTLNRTADATSASVHYALTPLTTLSLTGETRREHFEFSGNRDTESWSATTKMAFQPRALISGDAAVGYRKLQGQELSLPTFAGLIEALAAGTPVIVSDEVNLHGEVTASGVGAVVPMDVETLAREIDRWLADPALRRDAARRCRSLVRAKFDWAHIAQRWALRYAALARGDSPEAAA